MTDTPATASRRAHAVRFDLTRWQGVRPWLALAGLAAVLALALGAAHYMDVHGHVVTGMTNHVVWGLPHVFAVFLIVSASGALNVASVASVFGQRDYAPYARLSAVLAVSLLAGGLAVLVLDLGRPDRLIVAMTYYNFSSVFAWNIFLYTGFMLIVAVYLWFNMEPRLYPLVRRWGMLAFAWRIVLTTGTGCIFGFLVAREGYDAAIMAPLFVALSLSLGTAVFVLVLAGLNALDGRAAAAQMETRLVRLMCVFVLAALWLALVFHVANGYAAEHDGWQRFALHGGGGYTTLFWIGFVLFGSLVPLALVHTPLGATRFFVLAAAALVVLGGFSQLYVIIIAVQAYPMDLLPGWQVVESSFMDGQVAGYGPSLPELLLGLGGVALALLLLGIAVRVLAVLPEPGEPG